MKEVLKFKMVFEGNVARKSDYENWSEKHFRQRKQQELNPREV